jgi:hypothetical protein
MSNNSTLAIFVLDSAKILGSNRTINDYDNRFIPSDDKAGDS